MKILLLNPPADKKYIRDYFCAKEAKSYYYYHPMDLVYLSGTLSTNHDVAFLDAIADKLPADDVITHVRSTGVDAVIFLTAGISFTPDMAFVERLRHEHPHLMLIGTGDIYRELGVDGLRNHPAIDAILLDFSTANILTFLANPQAIEPIPNVIHRVGEAILDGKEVHGNGRFHLPMPRWDLVNLQAYSYPFERRPLFASMLTDFGCPYSCTFCPLSTVGFKLRDLDEVEKELNRLASLGVKDIYFRDQTFGVNKKRTQKLCDILERIGLGWTCFTRVDVLDDELADALKRGGCHTVMFGIESVDTELMRQYKKNTTADQCQRAIRLCKARGLDVVGFFILGLPGDTREKIDATVEFACRSGIDFCSFNVAMPRLGSSLRKEALATGAVELDMSPDSSKGTPRWVNQPLTNDEIKALQKRAVRRFYLRPGYLAKRLLGLSTLHQFRNFVREGLHLLF